MKSTYIIAVGALAFASTATSTTFDSNLIVNGSFEEHIVSGSWDLYEEIPGWTLESGPGIELQRGVGGWDAHHGEQWLELDADENGPGGGRISGEQGSSVLSQHVQTVMGQYYMLTLSFSPRPGVDDNHLIVKWNHEVIIDHVDSGLGLKNTSWQTINILIQGDGGLSKLELGDMSVNDTLGTFVDGVSLVAVPAPATLALLVLPLAARSRRRR